MSDVPEFKLVQSMDLCRKKNKETTIRESKKFYNGSYKKEIDDLDKPVTVVFELTEQTISEDGQMHLVPETELDLYWTTLDQKDEKQIIELYNQHGTCEQFHSELKTDMDLERLPSRNFNLHELVLIIGMLTYNILRFMVQISLKKQDSPLKGGVQRRRVRTVMQNLIMIASKLAKHARQLFLKFGSESPWFHTFKRIYESCG